MGFFRGLSYPLRGFSLVFSRYRGMAVWWIPPMLITFGLMGTGLWGTLEYYDDLAAWIWTPPQEGDDFTATALVWLYAVFETMLGLVVGALSLFLVAAMSGLVAAPFNDALSEALECRLTGQPAPNFSLGRVLRDAGAAIRIAIGRMTLYVAIMVPMWIVSLVVPGVGAVIYTVFGMVFTTMYLALDYVDWPATRRGWDWSQRLAWAGRHPGLLIGFGAAVWVLLFIPFLNLAFMPAAVAGGTQLFVDLEGPTRESSAKRGV